MERSCTMPSEALDEARRKLGPPLLQSFPLRLLFGFPLRADLLVKLPER